LPAVNDIVAVVPPTVHATDTDCDTSGTVQAVDELDALLAAESPLTLTALRRTEYEVPATKAEPVLCVVNVNGLVVPDAVA
jgi:hypothetical protein